MAKIENVMLRQQSDRYFPMTAHYIFDLGAYYVNVFNYIELILQTKEEEKQIVYREKREVPSFGMEFTLDFFSQPNLEFDTEYEYYFLPYSDESTPIVDGQSNIATLQFKTNEIFKALYFTPLRDDTASDDCPVFGFDPPNLNDFNPATFSKYYTINAWISCLDPEGIAGNTISYKRFSDAANPYFSFWNVFNKTPIKSGNYAMTLNYTVTKNNSQGLTWTGQGSTHLIQKIADTRANLNNFEYTVSVDEQDKQKCTINMTYPKPIPSDITDLTFSVIDNGNYRLTYDLLRDGYSFYPHELGDLEGNKTYSTILTPARTLTRWNNIQEKGKDIVKTNSFTLAKWERPAAATNLRFENNYFCWDSAEGAKRYEVLMNGKVMSVVQSTEKLQYSLSNLDGQDFGTFIFSVNAINDVGSQISGTRSYIKSPNTVNNLIISKINREEKKITLNWGSEYSKDRTFKIYLDGIVISSGTTDTHFSYYYGDGAPIVFKHNNKYIFAVSTVINNTESQNNTALTYTYVETDIMKDGIKKARIKLDEGETPDYPIVVDAENVNITYHNGEIDNVQNALDKKAERQYYQDDKIRLGGNPNQMQAGWSVAVGDLSTNASQPYSIAVGRNANAQGVTSISLGTATFAKGESSAAFNQNNWVWAPYSFGEGLDNTITENAQAAHAEGSQNRNNGNYSHTEGFKNVANGEYSHAEGSETTANKRGAHAEGFNTTANGNFSHVEGNSTVANGEFSHAEGSETTTNKKGAHAEGIWTAATGEASHVEGYGDHNWKPTNPHTGEIIQGYNEAAGFGSHAEGVGTKAWGYASHAEGVRNMITDGATGAHVGGMESIAKGNASFVHGVNCVAIGDRSSAFGLGNTAIRANQMVVGEYAESTSLANFIVGAGTAEKRYNAFAVDYNGNIWLGSDNVNFGEKRLIADNVNANFNSIRIGHLTTIKETKYSSSTYLKVPSLFSEGDISCNRLFERGRDYAEYIYPWEDNNINKEDRIGFFVTVKNQKIKKADFNDNIIGITSETYGILGSPDAMGEWHKKYQTDFLGRVIKDETGSPMLSEEYDDSKADSYISRSERPEWSAVGLMGQIYVRDDGTCIPGQWCKCADGGIATYADKQDLNTWIVLERVSDNTVKILFK